MEVDIEKILPVTEARDNFNKIVDEVENSDDLYVLTKNGKPSAVIVGVHHLEKLTGTSHKELMAAALSESIDEESSAEDTSSQKETADENSNQAATGTAINLDNFPADDTGNEPAPISAEDDLPAPTQVQAATPEVELEQSSVIPGITNIAADPTLSTTPFTTEKSEQTIGKSAALPPEDELAEPVASTAPNTAVSPTAPVASTAAIGQRGFVDPAAAPTDPTAQAVDDGPLEDPLDFLSNMDSETPSGAPAVPSASAQSPIVSPPAAPVQEIPVNPGNAVGFPDASAGANGSMVPDDIVAPTQGTYADPVPTADSVQAPVQNNTQQVQQ